MPPLFPAQIFLFLQTTNLWARTALQLDTDGLKKCLYSVCSTLRESHKWPGGPAQLLPPHGSPAHQALLPPCRHSSARWVSPSPALQMKRLAQTGLRAGPKLPQHLSFLSTSCSRPQDMTCLSPVQTASDLSPQTLESGGCFNVFALLLIISDKGATLSFLWEWKHKACLLRAVCRVRCWLTAQGLLSRHKRECKMIGVCVGLGTDREERGFVCLYSSYFLLLTDQTL